MEGVITLMVLMMMQNIANYTALVRNHKLYLANTTKYDDLDHFGSIICYIYQRRNDTTTLDLVQNVSTG